MEEIPQNIDLYPLMGNILGLEVIWNFPFFFNNFLDLSFEF